MGAMPVVVMDPTAQHGSALRGMVVRDAVGPLAQCRLDKPFGFAIGLWPVGAGEFMFNVQAPTRSGEAFRTEGRAVVGEHAAHRNAELCEVVDAGAQEGNGARAA